MGLSLPKTSDSKLRQKILLYFHTKCSHDTVVFQLISLNILNLMLVMKIANADTSNNTLFLKKHFNV